MSGLSTYLSNAIFAEYFQSTDAVYVGLHSADPTDAGTSSEVTTTIRAAGRVEVTFGAAVSKVITSNADADFGAADGGATVTHFSLWDAPSGGNCLGTDNLAAPRTVVAADPVLFPSGALSVDLA